MTSNVIVFDPNYFNNKGNKRSRLSSEPNDPIVAFVIRSCDWAVLCSKSGNVTPVIEGQPLREGDFILTNSEECSLVVGFTDGSRVGLSGVGQLSIEEFKLDLTRGEGLQSLNLHYGYLRFSPGTISIGNPDAARISYQKTTVTLRGATAEVVVDAETDQISIGVIPNDDGFLGQVEICSPYGSAILDRERELAVVDSHSEMIDKFAKP